MSSSESKSKKPNWLRVRATGSEQYLKTQSIIKAHNVHTVCQEAHCPNMGECWSQRTATFMIMGDSCTRACRFCAVKKDSQHLSLPDPSEPARVAATAAALELRHVVVTSVTRDDLPDNGSSCFSETVYAIRSALPTCTIELLIPDLQGSTADLQKILDAKPDVLNHNIETVRRLYPQVRPIADYQRSLQLLQNCNQFAPKITTKSGLMLGLGEQRAEVLSACRDLANVGVSILTLGQYLQPSPAQLSVERYLSPEEFNELKDRALELGFSHVESAPLTRSSYHAKEHLLLSLRHRHTCAA